MRPGDEEGILRYKRMLWIYNIIISVCTACTENMRKLSIPSKELARPVEGGEFVVRLVDAIPLLSFVSKLS